MAKIYLKFNMAVIKEIALGDGAITFGRKEGNDIVIDNPAVSSAHGKIIKEGNSYFVEDTGSTNGTFIGGRRIKKEKLKHKDQIRVARHILEFFDENATEDSAAPTPPPTAAPSPKPQPSMAAILEEPTGLVGGRPLPPPATITIVSGGVTSQKEYTITDATTYIGASDKAVIKIKGFMAPDLAAAISRKSDGYFLRAIKPGYPKVNGLSINEQTFLDSGALIEVGSTSMVFSWINPNKQEPPAESK